MLGFGRPGRSQAPRYRHGVVAGEIIVVAFTFEEKTVFEVSLLEALVGILLIEVLSVVARNIESGSSPLGIMIGNVGSSMDIVYWRKR